MHAEKNTPGIVKISQAAMRAETQNAFETRHSLIN